MAGLECQQARHILVRCGSRKYPYPHHRGSLENFKGEGVLKAKIFYRKYEPKLEFPEGGSNHQTLHRRSMDIFWNNTRPLSNPKLK